MSSGYEFCLASETEDETLRSVLRLADMPGRISLAFSREPSFFLAEQAGNLAHQTLICRRRANGQIVGVGSRSFRKLYVGGVPKTIGYLSNLRLLPEARNGITLARGYRYLRDLHGDGQVPYYLTTVLDDNRSAQRLLESGRGGLPTYLPVGVLVTYLIPIRKKVSGKLRSDVRVCDQGSHLGVLDCLSSWGRQYQFAPAYSLADILGRTSLLPNFSLGDLYTFERENQVVGTLGVWDQQAFKQTIVTGYSTGMKVAKLFWNGQARLRGLPTLPSAGGQIKSVFASLVSVRSSDPEVFRSLLDRARADWSGRGFDYLLVGLCEANPLSVVTRRLASRTLRSKVYLVGWPGERVVRLESGTPFHLEVATL